MRCCVTNYLIVTLGSWRCEVHIQECVGLMAARGAQASLHDEENQDLTNIAARLGLGAAKADTKADACVNGTSPVALPARAHARGTRKDDWKSALAAESTVSVNNGDSCAQVRGIKA